jgi:hypothetical protein
MTTTQMSRPKLRLAYAAAAFSHSKREAKDQAKRGNRDSARWWGEQARKDWQVLAPLLRA